MPPPRLRDVLEPASAARYFLWRVFHRGKTVELTTRDGIGFLVRPPPVVDLTTAMEVFRFHSYRMPAALQSVEVRLIVDLGANIGHSVAYLAHAHPAARILAFEPHPVHAALLLRTLELNRISDRVELHTAAASIRSASLPFRDAETSSRLLADGGPRNLVVPAIDWIAEFLGRRIDFLKMDIEGEEHTILADPRFRRLDIGCLVVEWHRLPDGSCGETRTLEVLHQAGFNIVHQTRAVENGLIWACKSARASS